MNFLSLQPESFGLDFSDLCLRIAKLKKGGRFLTLASWGETRIKPGIIEEGEVKDEAQLVENIKKALSQVRGEKLKTKNVIASLPEKKAFLQVIQMPKMGEEELKTALPFEAENYIPLPIEKVYLDFQIIPPVQDHLDHTDVLIAALPKKIIDPYLSCLKKAGLSPQALEVESQSIFRALIKNGLSLFPLFIIDFGRSRTSFIICSGFSLRFTCSIPLSSQELTEAIAKTFKIDLDEAEELKIKHGLVSKKSTENKKIIKAINPVLDDLVREIKRYITFYHSHRSHEHLSISNGQEINKILLCGKGANLSGLADFLSSELQISVKIGNPWINILPEPLKEVPGLSYKESLGYTTALGLALRGI